MGPLPPPDPQPLAPPTFAELYAVAREHLPERLRLLKVAPEDVEDTVHEVALIAHRKLDTYVPAPKDPRRSLCVWLSGIAWRYVAKQRGRAHRRREVPAGDVAPLATSEAEGAPSSEQLAAQAQRRVLWNRVLAKLRPERAEVLLMHVLFQMPMATIAEELNVNENTVKSRFARARRDALAVVRRLDQDEQNALRGSPLFAALLLERSWPSASEDRWAPEPPEQVGTRVSPAATIGSVLVAAMAAGTGLCGWPARGVEPPAIVAVHEPVPAVVATADAVVAPPVVVGVPTAAASPAHARGPASSDDALVREHALIRDARRALSAHAYDRAAAIVRGLEQEFPHGALATDRAWLTRQVARRREAKILDP